MNRVLSIALGVLATPLAAQSSLSGGGLLYTVQYGVRGSPVVRTGTWVGGGGTGRVGVLSLTIRGVSGTLTSSASSPQSTVHLTEVSVRVHPAPWLALGGEAEALRFETSGTTALWRLYGVGASVSAGIGAEGLAAVAEAALFPGTNLIPQDSVDQPGRVEVGLRYAPPRAHVEMQFTYRLERFPFKTTRTPERLAGLVASFGVRLGR